MIMFPQDRVTDHRLGRTVHGVREFLTGSVVLEDVIVELQAGRSKGTH